MTLTLRVLQAPQGVSQVDPRPLGPSACPYTIGRGPDNDWVLDDPDRHISKLHCRIEADGDDLYLVDVSSNGVFFATESRPVGHGKRRPLDSGDSFRIGDYRIGVVREAAAQIPPVAGGPEPMVREAETGISGILAGMNEASEHRAARSVTGAADEWLGTLPNGAVDEQIVQPLGWHTPPATSLTDLPEDLAQPISEFASLSEHLPAINAALYVGDAKAVLPMDWNLGEDKGASASFGVTPVPAIGGAADWGEAQRALMEGATLDGLVTDAPMADAGRETLVRTGGILRRLIDALSAIEAVQRTTERELGLSDGALPEENLTTLLAGAVWAADDAATDVLIQRLAVMARAARALGVAMADAAGEVGAQIAPEAVEALAREEARLAVGPLLRAAAWERYALVHANLSGGAETPAADVVLTPLRRVFSQRV